MARGKYHSVEEARRLGRLDQFAIEHIPTADVDAFETLCQPMTGVEKPVSKRKSGRE